MMADENIHLDTFSGNLDDMVTRCKTYSNGALNINNKLSILHINSRSIKNKFDEIQTFLASSGVDWSFVCVSETWLKDELLQYFELEQYNLFASCRPQGEGGGTAIYVNKKYEAIERKDLICKDLESVFVEVKLDPSDVVPKILIGEIYRPPNYPSSQFLDSLETVLDKIEKEKKMCLFSGDFNYNLLDLASDKYALSFCNIMHSYGYFPTISLATRCQKNKSSLLDNIFVNDMSVIHDSGVIIDDLSDHFPIFLTLDIEQHKIQAREERTVFDKTKVEQLNDYLVQRLRSFQLITNPNEACTELTGAYVDGIKLLSKTIKYSRRKSPLKPWITPSVLCSINRKTKLYKKFILKKTPESENKYKRYRNILTHVLRDAKRLYYCSHFQLNKNNGKKTWDLLKELINKRSNKNSTSPSTFTDTSGSVFEGNQISEGFNNFFLLLE